MRRTSVRADVEWEEEEDKEKMILWERRLGDLILSYLEERLDPCSCCNRRVVTVLASRPPATLREVLRLFQRSLA